MEMPIEENKNQIKAPRWWWPLWEFFLHTLVGSGFFVLIAIPAVAIDYLVAWLEGQQVARGVLLGLTFGEYMLFLVDLMLFLIFLFRAAARTIPRL